MGIFFSFRDNPRLVSRKIEKLAGRSELGGLSREQINVTVVASRNFISREKCGSLFFARRVYSLLVTRGIKLAACQGGNVYLLIVRYCYRDSSDFNAW